MERKPNRVVAIVGPTGTGKTALSLALANHFDLEVIACDSRTVFRHLNIGTAKPTLEEQRVVNHHMLDVVEPNESYTVAQYKQSAEERIENILSRFKQPVVCGGTGFYARALLEGIDIPQISPQIELRTELNNFADQKGNHALHQRLMEIDPSTASRLHLNDRFRVVRALEVSITSGKAFSQLTRKVESPYDVCWIGLTFNDPKTFKVNLETRLRKQFQDGLVNEVRSLYEHYGAVRSLMNTVNYKEVIEQLTGAQDFEQSFEKCLLRNYQLARKQLIWFRANKNIKWHAIDECAFDQLVGKVANEIRLSQSAERRTMIV
jgi:tRNA dimethylallyltransferase